MSILSERCRKNHLTTALIVHYDTANTSPNITISANTRQYTRGSVSAGSWFSTRSLISRNSGKYYVEQKTISLGSSANGELMFGVGLSSFPLTTFAGSDSTAWGIQNNPTGGTGANVWHNGSLVNASTWGGSVGDYFMIAVDFTAGNMWLGVNGSWYGGGNPSTGSVPTFTFTPGTLLYFIGSANNPPARGQSNAVVGEFSGLLPSGFSAWLP